MAAGTWCSGWLPLGAWDYGDQIDVVGENTTCGDIAAQEPGQSKPLAASGGRGRVRSAVTAFSGSPLLDAGL